MYIITIQNTEDLILLTGLELSELWLAKCVNPLQRVSKQEH